MTEDEIITRLVDFHDHIEAPATPPQLDAQRGQRLVRRRRTGSVLATAAAVALAVGIVQVTFSDDHRSVQPAPQPSPTPTEAPSPTPTESPTPIEPPAPGDKWTPEQIRALGSSVDSSVPSESGLSWHRYAVCPENSCEPFGAEGTHVALEVTQNGLSALFEVRGISPIAAFVRVFDEDSVLVQDRSDLNAPRRTRLLQADGTAMELRMLDDPALPVPGPDLFVIDSHPEYTGYQDIFLVDDRAGTLRPLDAPDEDVREWWPKVDELLLGVSYSCRVFWANAGTIESRLLDCANSTSTTWIYEGSYPDGWPSTERLVVAESEFNSGAPSAIHVSLDSGATWQRIPAQDKAVISGILQTLG